MRTSRRSFLKRAAAAAAATPFILPSHIWAADTKPNSRLAMGFIGMGIQSRHLLGAFLGQETQVLAVCDVDSTRRNDAKKRVDDYYAKLPGRGGSCKAEVVISDAPVEYPYVVNPQVLVVLSQDAYTEYGCKAAPETRVIIDSDLVKGDSTQEPKPISIPASRMAQELGRPVVANIIMLGFLAATTDLVTTEALRQAVLDSIPAGTESFNLNAFELGYKYGSEHFGKS